MKPKVPTVACFLIEADQNCEVPVLSFGALSAIDGILTVQFQRDTWHLIALHQTVLFNEQATT